MAWQLRVFERITDIAPEAWDALHTDEDSPFVEWEWLAALEAARCVHPDTGWAPRHLTVWRDGLLVGAAPAYVKGHSEGEFVFDWGWADAARKMGLRYYPKLVLAVPFTPATGTRVLRAPGESLDEITGVLAQGACEVVERLGLSGAHVLFPHEAECNAFVREGFAERVGMQFHWHNESYTTIDDFLARFQSKKRNAIKREIAQPSRDGTTIVTHRGESITPDLVEPMHTFYTTTVDKFHYGRRYLNRAFFQQISQRFAHRLEWVVARDAGGTPIAGAFNVARGKRMYGRYWGATEERPFLHFNVCFYHGIDDCIRQGRTLFEPGAGGEHKLARGFDPTLTYSAHYLADDTLDRPVRDFLRREGVAVRRHVEEELAASPLRRKET